jgi:hypothetical protein
MRAGSYAGFGRRLTFRLIGLGVGWALHRVSYIEGKQPLRTIVTDFSGVARAHETVCARVAVSIAIVARYYFAHRTW